MRVFASTLLCVLALDAQAGIAYRFVTRSTSALRPVSSGRVWIDGDRKRIELDPDPANPRPFDVSILAKGDATLVNLQNKTYYVEKRIPDVLAVGGSTLFHLPWPDDRIKGRPKITHRNAGAGPAVGDYPTTRHVIQVAYELTGEFRGVTLQGEVEATVTVLLAQTLRQAGDRTILGTGFQGVDDALTRLSATIEGLCVGSELSVSRKLEGGAVITETTVTTVDQLATVDVDEKVFIVPRGFTYQEPVYGFAAPNLPSSPPQ